jgi:putative selenium metabolism protein SsnA
MLLKNATCVTLNPPSITRSDIQIENGVITTIDIGASGRPAKGSYDLKGKLLLPGFVCAHTHIYSALARGMPAPKGPTEDFRQILENVWWKLDNALDEEMIRASAMLYAIEAIKCGTTTIIDHHSSPQHIRGSLNVVDDALDAIGLRRVLCYEITDREGESALNDMFKESRDFLASSGRSLSRGMVGAHAPFTLSDTTLERCGQLTAEFNCGVHIHLAEDGTDPHDAQMRYGVLVTERLKRAGLLNNKSILAHCVKLSATDRAAVVENGAWVAHNPRSNMNNRVGRAAIEAFGSCAVLGTDSIGADMLEELKTAFYRGHEETRSIPDKYVNILANNQRLVSSIFGQEFGRFEIGSPADFVVLDYESPTPLTADNLTSHVIFGWSSSMVDSVMVAGNWLMRKRKLVNIDTEKIYAEAAKQATRLWERL